MGATTGGSEGSGGNGFLPPDTDRPISAECDIWTQDCPPGEKCAPWVHEGNYWTATRCVPVDPKPNEPGEVCTAEAGGNSGIDSCMHGSMCWDVDPKTGEGVCVAHCVGSEAAPVCEDPATTCSISGDGFLTLCLPACNPLDPEACETDEGCYSIDTGFICASDGSGKGGGVFEPCEFINGCDAGLSCVGAERLDICDAPGCCTPYCDLNAPVCPDLTACNPYVDAGEVSPGSEHVGSCSDDARM